MDLVALPNPAKPLEGRYLCTVPPALGEVTHLEWRGEKLVAQTTSGIPLIVPLAASQP